MWNWFNDTIDGGQAVLTWLWDRDVVFIPVATVIALIVLLPIGILARLALWKWKAPNSFDSRERA